MSSNLVIIPKYRKASDSKGKVSKLITQDREQRYELAVKLATDSLRIYRARKRTSLVMRKNDFVLKTGKVKKSRHRSVTIGEMSIMANTKHLIRSRLSHSGLDGQIEQKVSERLVFIAMDRKKGKSKYVFLGDPDLFAVDPTKSLMVKVICRFHRQQYITRNSSCFRLYRGVKDEPGQETQVQANNFHKNKIQATPVLATQVQSSPAPTAEKLCNSTRFVNPSTSQRRTKGRPVKEISEQIAKEREADLQRKRAANPPMRA